MNLFFLTFRKDVRRLWPIGLVTLLMLAELTRRDRWRADWAVSSTEGWLAILLTFAWSCLAALDVLEEPLVGDRYFWTTRPFRWPSLLAAKLAFAAAFIQAPALLADIYILSARGFSPSTFASNLLAKQALLLGLITLPSMAIAAIVRSFTQFVVAAFGVAAAILIANGGLNELTPRIPQNHVRQAIVKALVALAAPAVLTIMYAWRRALTGRIVAAVAFIASISAAAWLPARAEYLHYGPESLSVALRDVPRDSRFSNWYRGNRHIIALPISLQGHKPSESYDIPFIDLQIEVSGRVLRSIQPRPDQAYQKIALIASIESGAILVDARPGSYTRPNATMAPSLLILSFSDAAWNFVKVGPAHLRGQVGFHFFRFGPVSTVGLGRAAAVPNVGRCAFEPADFSYSEGMVKVFCESPDGIPPAQIRFRIPGRDQFNPATYTGLNNANSHIPGPQKNWLSPLYRGQAYREVYPRVPPDSPFHVSPEEYSRTVVDIKPILPAGDARASFDFINVPLAKWLVPSRRP